MNESIKLTFVPGLREVVLQEISTYSVLSESDNAVYIKLPKNLKETRSLKSIISAYLSIQSEKLNPIYLHKHKSILGTLIEKVSTENKFKTFRIRCAGSQSKEIVEIEKYVQETYKLTKAEDADLEIYINKIGDMWELLVRLSPRPLSVRDYKVSSIKGGLNPNIAYAINSFCDLKHIDSYLNIFSGSGTLLIEAGLVNPSVKLVGIDIDKKANSGAIQNIKKAGLIKNIQIKTGDIYDNPELGTFDTITANLPFGMQVSKGEDLEKLYSHFLQYSAKALRSKGRLVAYTSESELFEKVMKDSKFTIVKTLDLTTHTSVNSYLCTRIFACDLIY